jgi:hypothetical protein
LGSIRLQLAFSHVVAPAKKPSAAARAGGQKGEKEPDQFGWISEMREKPEKPRKSPGGV